MKREQKRKEDHSERRARLREIEEREEREERRHWLDAQGLDDERGVGRVAFEQIRKD